MPSSAPAPRQPGLGGPSTMPSAAPAPPQPALLSLPDGEVRLALRVSGERRSDVVELEPAEPNASLALQRQQHEPLESAARFGGALTSLQLTQLEQRRVESSAAHARALALRASAASRDARVGRGAAVLALSIESSAVSAADALGRKRTHVLLVLDGLYLAVFYALFCSTLSKNPDYEGSCTNALTITLLACSMAATVSGIASIVLRSPEGLATYTLVQLCLTLVLLRTPFFQWEFLMLRSFALTAALHVRMRLLSPPPSEPTARATTVVGLGRRAAGAASPRGALAEHAAAALQRANEAEMEAVQAAINNSILDMVHLENAGLAATAVERIGTAGSVARVAPMPRAAEAQPHGDGSLASENAGPSEGDLAVSRFDAASIEAWMHAAEQQYAKMRPSYVPSVNSSAASPPSSPRLTRDPASIRSVAAETDLPTIADAELPASTDADADLRAYADLHAKVLLGVAGSVRPVTGAGKSCNDDVGPLAASSESVGTSEVERPLAMAATVA